MIKHVELKHGDKVKCVSGGVMYNLTIGKIYTIETNETGHLLIRNDKDLPFAIGVFKAHFELVEDKEEIEVGDLVECTHHYDDRHWSKGHQFIVTKVEGYKIFGKTKSREEGSIPSTSCKLISKGKIMSNKEKDLKEVNNALEIVNEFIRVYKDKFIVQWNDGSIGNKITWPTKFDFQKPKFEEYKTKKQNYLVKFNAKDNNLIEVGCQTFTIDILKNILYDFVIKKETVSYNGTYRATCDGILSNGYTFDWEDAKGLYEKIKDL